MGFTPEMRALVREGGRLVLATVPTPSPQADEVLVRVERAAICRTDVAIAYNRLAVARDPLTLGHELAGVIVARGGAVTALADGDHVAVFPWSGCGSCAQCASDRPYLCDAAQMLGMHRHGAFADYVAVPTRSVHRVDQRLDWNAVAYAEPVAAALAVTNAPIGKQQRGVIAGDSRFAELTRRVLAARGFTDLVVTADVAALPTARFDFAIETSANAAVLGHLVRALAPRGVLVLKSRATSPVALDLGELVRKEITSTAVSYGPFGEALALLGSLRLDDLAGPVYALEDYVTAFAQAESDERRKIFFGPSR